jgi:hypothetical protein
MPIAAIIAILQALPELLKLIEQLGPELANLVKQLVAYINHASGNDPQGYVKKVGEALAKLNGAKTQQERQDAAKAIADAIHGLR